MLGFTAGEHRLGETYILTTSVGVMLRADRCVLLTAMGCSCCAMLSANQSALLIAKRCCCCAKDRHPLSVNNRNELLLCMTKNKICCFGRAHKACIAVPGRHNIIRQADSRIEASRLYGSVIQKLSILLVLNNIRTKSKTLRKGSLTLTDDSGARSSSLRARSASGTSSACSERPASLSSLS